LTESAGPKAFATEERSGVAPLDPDLVVEDIAAAAREADVVLVSLYWGLLDSPRVHPRQRFLARGFLQAGAHAVLGHHPHVPQGIEVVDGTLVAYSLDTLVFPHSHDAWTDNMPLRLTCAPGRIVRAEVIPVVGRGAAVGQPYVMEGDAAGAHLRTLQQRSAELGTRMEIGEEVGVIQV
jgi:poly-gamma-glutamate capsule biosynthesis protein CapA/YwtB (metallophosphatase superfamily)